MREFSDNQFLNRHRNDVKSQFGEDGIIEKIFTIIPAANQNHWSCEFGAWDGLHCSNTYHLIMNKGWRGVLIEADKRKFRELQATYRDCSRATLLNQFVGFSGPMVLDNILESTECPKDFDFLSIDIDGNDYHTWATLERFKPKVVVIEFNPCIPNDIEFVQKADVKVRHGTSILSMTKLALSKGYELICVNAENAFYVDREYFGHFGIKDNSIDSLKYYREPLRIYQLFDGTLAYHGEPHCLYWYNLPVDLNKLQVLPKFVRDAHTPWGGNWILRGAIKLLRLYRHRFWKRDTDYGKWKL